MEKVMLIVIDGFGVGKNYEGNAAYLAKTPNFDNLLQNCPHSLIDASEEYVGLPKGQMGNSEVGHLNIGAGRVVYQDLLKINNEINSLEFFKNKELNRAIDHAIKNNKALHIMGLVSKGGVHSHMDHSIALLELCKKKGLKRVYVHAFLDGRDVLPTSGIEDIKYYITKMEEIGVGKLQTVSGRYYAMDRDKRWERTKKSYDAIVFSRGEKTIDILETIKKSYENGITDEFFVPTIVGDENIEIENEDSIIFFNFRPDRARQLTRAIVKQDFKEFERKDIKTYFVSFTLYDDEFNDEVKIAYKKGKIQNSLGEYLSKKGLKQLRIAETEKYPHVTFFFNGGEETPYPREDRVLINSPKVATYDLKPEMSAYEMTDSVLEKMDSKKYEFIVMNFANADMVGHTAVKNSVIKAVETVDECLGKIIKSADKNGYTLFITADHGNCEYIIDEKTKKPYTAHTLNKVPFVIYPKRNIKLKDGSLKDIAPTILDIMKIEKPSEMTGISLIEK